MKKLFLFSLLIIPLLFSSCILIDDRTEEEKARDYFIDFMEDFSDNEKEAVDIFEEHVRQEKGLDMTWSEEDGMIFTQ